MTLLTAIEVKARDTGRRMVTILGPQHRLRRGLTVGGLPDSTIRLDGPSAEGTEVQFQQRSNHLFRIVLSAPPGSPLHAEIDAQVRIDSNALEIGAYSVCVRTLSLDRTVSNLRYRGTWCFSALEDLAHFGAAGRPAIPRLLANLLDPKPALRLACLAALRTLGVDAGSDPVAAAKVHELLTRFASDDDSTTRARARGLLDDIAAAEALRPELTDPDPARRLAAAGTLWEATRSLDGVLEVLQAILAGPSSAEVVEKAASLTSDIGPPCRAFIPDLERAAASGNAQAEILFALTAIGGEALPVLERLWEKGSAAMRRDAAHAFAVQHAENDALLPLMIRCLERETDADVAYRLIQALGHFERRAAGAAPALRKAARTFATREVSKAVANALLEVEGVSS